MGAYLRPVTLDDALAALGARPHRVLAGGTDVFAAEAGALGWGGAGIDHPDAPPILDLGALAALRTIRCMPDRVEIGALVTWSEAIESDLPAWFDGVREAGRAVGGRQIQNRATLAGNLCNASPAADGVPALLALDARVRLQRHRAAREVALDAFVLGNRRTGLAPDELLTAIVVPTPPPGLRATFLKLGARRYLVISITMVAACLEMAGGRIVEARIAVGACSEVARRLHPLERRLRGVPAPRAADVVRDEDFDRLSPIDDVRASAAYRRHAARVLVARALAALAAPARARP